MVCSSIVLLHIYQLIATTLWQNNGTHDIGRHKVIEAMEETMYSLNKLREIAMSARSSVLSVNESFAAIHQCLNANSAPNGSIRFCICSAVPDCQNLFDCPLKNLSTAPTMQSNSSTAAVTSIDKCQEEYKALFNFRVVEIYTLFALSVAFIGILSFTKKRKNRSKCCGSRPGLLVPGNLLDAYENRFGTALAYGASATFCFSMFLYGPALYEKLYLVLIVGLIPYPLFICMKTKYRMVGSLFGTCYCMLWLCAEFYYLHLARLWLAHCQKYTRIFIFYCLAVLPVLLCITFLLLKFMKRIIRHLRTRDWNWNATSDPVSIGFQHGYMYTYVRNLLRIRRQTVEKPQSYARRLLHRVYKWDTEFKYPIKMIFAIVMSAILLYMLVQEFMYLLVDICGERCKQMLETFFPGQTVYPKIVACFYLALILSTSKMVIILFNILASFRKDIKRLRQGDKSFLPPGLQALEDESVSLVHASMKYAGYQIAFILYGYIISFTVFFVLMIEVIFEFTITRLLLIKGKLWTVILSSFLIWLAQRLAVKFFFLRKRGNATHIDNRNAFHVMSYFMLFYNIFIGLFAALRRILINLFLGVIFFERMQKSLLPKSFEKFDRGYRAYVGMLLVEHSQVNAVIHVFFYLLNQTARSGNSKFEGCVPVASFNYETLEDDKKAVDRTKKKRSLLVRNRWSLVYTLTKNPSLIKYRRKKATFDVI